MSKQTGIVERFKQKADQLKQEVYALYLAYKDPRVSWYARLFAACVIGYALSPIDLIPDFIPVLGYLDDLILLPLGIGMALKMIPPAVLAECRQKASDTIGYVIHPRAVLAPLWSLACGYFFWFCAG